MALAAPCRCAQVRSDPDFELGTPTAPMVAAARRAVFER
jgi:hypothetical protein